MRKVKVSIETKANPQLFWDNIIDVKNWDSLIEFVKKIHISEYVKEGIIFLDTTSILWIPTVIKHRITKIEKYKKFYMEAYLPLKTGIMYQTIDIYSKGEIAHIVIEIKFKINFFLFDFIFGTILEKRLKTMIIKTLHKLKDKNPTYKNSIILGE